MKNIHIATYQDKAKKLAEVLPDYKVPVVIRLGGTLAYKDYPIEINTRKAVKNCINKLMMKQIMINGGVITLPLVYEPIYPMIVKGITRSMGTSVFLVESKEQLAKVQEKTANEYYAEPLFKATSEYRLHATKEKVFFSVKKIRNEGHENDLVINSKNHHNIKDFTKPRLWKEMEEQCVKSMNLLGLDIGAFDVMYDSSNDKKHEFTIAEVNTNPELLTNTFNAYVEQIDKMIKEKIKQLK